MDELRVKVGSLAAEARIIRRLEASIRRKWRKSRERTAEQVAELHHRHFVLREHRIREVRPEARATQLAIGFLRGRSYQQMEPTTKSKPDWARVERLVKRYGSAEKAALVAAWATVEAAVEVPA